MIRQSLLTLLLALTAVSAQDAVDCTTTDAPVAGNKKMTSFATVTVPCGSLPANHHWIYSFEVQNPGFETLHPDALRLQFETMITLQTATDGTTLNSNTTAMGFVVNDHHYATTRQAAFGLPEPFQYNCSNVFPTTNLAQPCGDNNDKLCAMGSPRGYPSLSTELVVFVWNMGDDLICPDGEDFTIEANIFVDQVMIQEWGESVEKQLPPSEWIDAVDVAPPTCLTAGSRCDGAEVPTEGVCTAEVRDTLDTFTNETMATLERFYPTLTLPCLGYTTTAVQFEFTFPFTTAPYVNVDVAAAYGSSGHFNETEGISLRMTMDYDVLSLCNDTMTPTDIFHALSAIDWIDGTLNGNDSDRVQECSGFEFEENGDKLCTGAKVYPPLGGETTVSGTIFVEGVCTGDLEVQVKVHDVPPIRTGDTPSVCNQDLQAYQGNSICDLKAV